MSHDHLPMRMLLTIIAKWVNAVENCHADDAVFFADELRKVGTMLTADPEFGEIYHEHRHQCTARNSQDALECVHAFLHTVTDAARTGRFRDGDPQ